MNSQERIQVAVWTTSKLVPDSPGSTSGGTSLWIQMQARPRLGPCRTLKRPPHVATPSLLGISSPGFVSAKARGDPQTPGWASLFPFPRNPQNEAIHPQKAGSQVAETNLCTQTSLFFLNKGWFLCFSKSHTKSGCFRFVVS